MMDAMASKNEKPEVIDTAREMRSKGGKARMALLTPQERVALAKKNGRLGGLARASRLTAAQRQAIAALGGQAFAARARARRSDADQSTRSE